MNVKNNTKLSIQYNYRKTVVQAMRGGKGKKKTSF